MHRTCSHYRLLLAPRFLLLAPLQVHKEHLRVAMLRLEGRLHGWVERCLRLIHRLRARVWLGLLLRLLWMKKSLMCHWVIDWRWILLKFKWSLRGLRRHQVHTARRKLSDRRGYVRLLLRKLLLLLLLHLPELGLLLGVLIMLLGHLAASLFKPIKKF